MRLRPRPEGEMHGTQALWTEVEAWSRPEGENARDPGSMDRGVRDLRPRPEGENASTRLCGRRPEAEARGRAQRAVDAG